MDDTKKKWLMGCGIGCGVLLILLILGGVGAVHYFKSMFTDFKHAEASQKALTAQFGEVSSYTPPADGAIPADRIEAFLGIRGTLNGARNEIVASFKKLKALDEKDKKEKSFRIVFSAVQSGVGFGRTIGKFIRLRNEALLERNMGMGEYTYIYTIAFHSWLKHPMTLGFESDNEGETRRDDAPSDFVKRLHQDMLGMMRNQAEAVKNAGDPAGLQAGLEEEISRMEADRYRIPWQDGLPDTTVRSLESYRDRLEESYNPFLGVLELGIDEDEGTFNFHFK